MTYVETILDTEEYKGLTKEHFIEGDMCVDDFLSTPAEFRCLIKSTEDRVESCRKCWNSENENGEAVPYNGGAEYSREEVIAAYNNEMNRRNKEQLPDNPAEPAGTTAFDYSELDGNTAEELQRITENVVRVKQQYVFGMAEQVKKAHNLLANHYKGTFGKWCEFIGISDDTAERLIDVSAFCGNITAEENERIQSLPKSLLYTVSKDDKQGKATEAVQAVLDGDITTHKDYIALKKQLEEEKERANSAHKEYLAENQINTELMRKNAQLEKEVKELENRPQTAAYDIEEVDRKVKETVGIVEKQLEEKRHTEEMQYNETIREKDDKIWALEDRVKELETAGANDGTAIYILRIKPSDYTELLNAVKGKPYETAIKQAKIIH